MRRLSFVGLTLLAILLVASPWLDPTRVILGTITGEAFAAGRPASFWREQLRGGPADKAAALSALQSPAAVPVLKALLRPGGEPRDLEVRLSAIDLLAQLGADAHEAGGDVLALLAADDPAMHPAAAAAVPKLGVPAAAAIPALAKMLAAPVLDSPAVVPAIRAISTYKGEARETVAVFEKILLDTSQQEEVRWNAARTIGKIGPDAVSAVPTLVDMLDDSAETIREHSSEALGDIGPTAAHAIPHMLPLLTESPPRIRRDTVRSFGYMGPAAKETIPHILPLLNDPEFIVREATKTAILAIDPSALPKPPEPAAPAQPQDASPAPETTPDAAPAQPSAPAAAPPATVP